MRAFAPLTSLILPRRRLALRALVPLLCLLAAAPAAAQGTTYTAIERGRYLVSAGDCASCHTAAGGKPFAGGLAIATPFGTIYSTNITPDPATGIGKWSDQDFYRAMHSGMRRDGKLLYPAFPYPWFTKISRADVRAIRAFLNTLTPVHQENKKPELPWPLSTREVMKGWNTSSSARANSSLSRTSRSNGTAALIWSKGSAIAAPAIPPATCWARRRRTKGWKAAISASTGMRPV